MSNFLKNNITLQQPLDGKLLEDHLIRLKVDVKKCLEQFSDLNMVRKQAKNIRHESIEHLDEHLIDFEKNAIDNGSKIYWASTASEAVDRILKIITQTGASSIYKTHAPELKELELNSVFEQEGVNFEYLNAGEKICSILGEKPRHPLFPLAGVQPAYIKKGLQQHFKLPAAYTTEKLMSKLRDETRDLPKFPSLSICSPDFLVAENGALVFSDNEGISSWASSCVNIQIVVAGIERVIPSMEKLQNILPLHDTFHYAEKKNKYHNYVFGPAQKSEKSGPTQMYVILLDNGRTDLLATSAWREILYDLDAISFFNNCHVYPNVQQNNYHPHLVGPLGMLLGPLLFEEKEYGHLPFLNYNQDNRFTNPYLIDFEKMLMKTRSWVSKEEGYLLESQPAFKEGMKAVADRDKMNELKDNPEFKNSFKNFTGRIKDLLFSPKSFNEWWKERKK